MKVLFKMPVKTFLKIVCVSTFFAGSLVGGSLPSFSQSEGKLEDPGYGLHIRRTNEKEKKKTESGLIFTRKEINQWKIRQKKITRRYESLVSDIMSDEKDSPYQIASMRNMYARTPYYDPFSKYTVRKLTEYAYTADMASDQQVINEALAEYRNLLHKHIANFGVVEYALTLARVNPIYGDKIRLKKIYDALIKDIEGPILKGRSPRDAYRIVTYPEETYLLALHEVTVQKSEIYRVDNIFYNVHDTLEKEDQHSQLYFDVTWPIYLYEKNIATKESDDLFSLPAQ